MPGGHIPVVTPEGAATESTVAALLKEGTDITGAAMPAGGASGRGWLSAIWTTLTGIHAPAAANVVAAGIADVQGVAATANLRLVGYSVRESAATPAAASVSLRHGTLATDPLLLPTVVLAAGGRLEHWFGPDGIACPGGIFVDRATGNTELVLYTKAVA